MTVLAIILGILAVAAAVMIALALAKPNAFRVTRSTVISAPPERVFSLIDDFHEWRKWSPYENRDPALKRSYDGPTHGLGAIYAWEGNSNIGSGRMEIVRSAPPQQVTIKLDFMKPFEAHNTAEFTILPREGGPTVTWAMHGPAPFISKVMQVFMNFDTMIGKDFEAGLANLKSVAEQQPATLPHT